MLSNMLDNRPSDYPRSQPPVSQSAWNGQTRAHQPQTGPASTLASNPYSSQSRLSHSRPSQRLPSPPDSMEEVREAQKCSLPGISNLLTDLHRDENPGRSNRDSPIRKASIESLSHQQDPNSRYRYPPTPPLRPESGLMTENSSPQSQPSHQSSFSAPSTHYHYVSSSFNNLEPYAQRQMTYPPITHKRPSVTSQGYSPYSSSSVHGSPTASTGSYQMSPVEAPSPSSSLLYQRSLPTNFPPPLPPQPLHMLSSYPNLPPWQQHSHHHHFPPSSIAPYPQSPDRYICPQCNKAFSRPSSLKIHSHSHTGEKPFKCGHPNCGKAFSVRSNMKRHEKGCHGDGSGPNPMMERLL